MTTAVAAPTTAFLVRSVDELDDDNHPLFWSNRHGWVPAPNATVFAGSSTTGEPVNDLPVGGEWVKIEGAPRCFVCGAYGTFTIPEVTDDGNGNLLQDDCPMWVHTAFTRADHLFVPGDGRPVRLPAGEPGDPRDNLILFHRQTALLDRTGIGEGDWVDSPEWDTPRRVSHVWHDDHGAPEWVQLSTGGSWYLGDGHISFSGSLDPSLPAAGFSDTGSVRPATVWFFHHDQWRAHNGISARVYQRVWTFTAP